MDFPSFEHLSFTGGDPQAWGPLHDFMGWWLETTMPFKLQISTALARPITDAAFWRAAIEDVRVSFDAVDPLIYAKRRGDRTNTPGDILDRMRKLKHARLSTITTVGPDNIENMPATIYALRRLAEDVPFRKAMFLPVLGPKGVGGHEQFWEQWEDIREVAATTGLPTSFAENPLVIRKEIEAAPETRCWAERMSFHLKPNGDLFPCCLIGGEALPTQYLAHYGNVHELTLETIYAGFREKCQDPEDELPPQRYEDCECGCKDICQFKQFQLNLACENASRVRLAMP